MALYYRTRGVCFPSRDGNVIPFPASAQARPLHIGAVVQSIVSRLLAAFDLERTHAKADYDASDDRAAYIATMADIYDRQVCELGRDPRAFPKPYAIK